MRVLHLIKGLGPGGAEQLLVTHLQLTERERFDLEVCYLVPVKDHNQPKCEAAGARVVCLGARRSADVRWVLRMWRFLASNRADVVHMHSPLVASVARVWYRVLHPLITRRPRPALVYTEHNRWPRHDRLTRAANRLTYRLDDVQLAVSEDVRQSIPRRPRRRVEVLTHGVDRSALRGLIGERDAARKEMGATPDDIVVGIVANYRREKRHDRWLDAARIALDAENRLLFVGIGQGRLEREIRETAAKHGFGDRVRFLGYRPDAARLTTGFDIFTLASDHEGKPVALMEAMTLGLPTVATRAGGIPEMLRDGVDGILVDASAGALARAYVELSREQERRRAMGLAAAAHSQQFDARTATARLEAIYEDLRASNSR